MRFPSVSPWLRGFLVTLFIPIGFGWTSGEESKALFVDASDATGLQFVHDNGGSGEYHLPEIMGPGAALLDYDGDGDLDLYLVQGGSLEAVPDQRPQNRLFRNDLDKSLRWTDVTDQSGLGDQGYGMGVAVGDYDGDGHPDLYVTNFDGNALYRNTGEGSFVNVTQSAGVAEKRWSTSAAFLDYDRDGDLDLFVTNYIDFTIAGHKTCFDSVGNRDYCNPDQYRPVSDRLFRNEGGKFVDQSEESGIAFRSGPGLGVAVADYDGDGWVDLYVANDGAANFLWLNNGDGTFREDALLRGAAHNAEGVPEGSMGVTAGDFDNDADEDLFMTHLTGETNTLYVNHGHGEFRDETSRLKLALPSLEYTGFGTEWFDYDNDRWLDLFVANGAVRRLEVLRDDPFPYHQRNQLFRNKEGQSFQETTEEAGSAFTPSEVSRGAAFGDVDNDGDVDLVVTNNRGPARLLLNDANGRNWLVVRLSASIIEGTKLGFVLPAGEILWRRAHRDGSYLSGNDPRVHVGLGSATRVQQILVIWPSGRKEAFSGSPSRSFLLMEEGKGFSWPEDLDAPLPDSFPIQNFGFNAKKYPNY